MKIKKCGAQNYKDEAGRPPTVKNNAKQQDNYVF
jgi:hypothetical protein